jgi:hypothetical protein
MDTSSSFMLPMMLRSLKDNSDIRGMCEQGAIPKALVDIAIAEPAKLDELERQAEG